MGQLGLENERGISVQPVRNGSRPLKPEEEGIAGGFEAWTLWGEASENMLSDPIPIAPYGDLTASDL